MINKIILFIEQLFGLGFHCEDYKELEQIHTNHCDLNLPTFRQWENL